LSKHLVHNEVLSESPLEQRPRFERLVRRVAAEGLEPYGFERETSRLWTRMASPDVTHEVEWQKGKWTRQSAVMFYVNLRAHWVTGPNVAWPDASEPVRPLIVSSRLRITSDDPAFDQVAEPSQATSQDRRSDDHACCRRSGRHRVVWTVSPLLAGAAALAFAGWLIMLSAPSWSGESR
jgi:hypothetical protein